MCRPWWWGLGPSCVSLLKIINCGVALVTMLSQLISTDSKQKGTVAGNPDSAPLSPGLLFSSRSLLLDGEELVVSLVTRVGRGLWVTFVQKCTLNLYHLDTLVRLQEINLSRIIRDFVQSKFMIY